MIAIRINEIDVEQNALIIEVGEFPDYENAEAFIRQLCDRIHASCKEVERSADLVQARIDYSSDLFLLEINWTSEAIWFTALHKKYAQALEALKQQLVDCFRN